MEASVASANAGTGGAQGDAGSDGGQGQGQGQGGGDLSGITSTLAGVQEAQQEMRTALASLVAQQGGQGEGAEGGDEGGDEGMSAAEYDFGFLENQDIAGDPEKLRGEFESTVQKALAPILQQQQDLVRDVNAERVQREFDDLVQRYPDMGEKDHFDPILKAARDYVQLKGFPAQMAESPAFLELMYLSERAITRSQDEEDGQNVAVANMEGGGGARQVTPDQMKELGKQIVSGGRNDRGSMPFG